MFCVSLAPASLRRVLDAEVLPCFLWCQVAAQAPARRVDHRVETGCPYSCFTVARGGDKEFLVRTEGRVVHEAGGVDSGNFLPCPGVPQPSRLVAAGGERSYRLY